MRIVRSGKVVVNNSFEAPNARVLYVDLQSKRADVFCTGSNGLIPMVILCATSETLHLDEQNLEEHTEIEFPEFKEWQIVCAEVARYTLYIAFTKHESIAQELSR